MQKRETKRYLIVHGHFYQPPRENPWTGRIERQSGAAPHHDWNERIARECYAPNARSRRLDGYGRVLSIVDNYAHISFNFGPTLLAWIETHHAALYRRIIEADAAGARRLGGRGNAIAQVYNHLIMPLAVRRDQRTQVRWGMADFRRRFGRDPEGIWLAETAVNEKTLEILIEHGLRFTILSPHQAQRVRPLAGGEWRDVTDGSLPTGKPYRCFGPRRARGRKRWIDIFFYDAPLSVDASFNHLLRSGDALADAVTAAYARGGGDLVTLAADGEIFGHHEPFADMALAYLIDAAASERGITLTNFSAYLDDHEPADEVQIKPGRGGEGTAWSCAHGVGRWKEDCGCRIGSAPGWNQQWRAPLRQGLDDLRDALAEIYESEGGELLTDPWAARDGYIAVCESDRSAEATGRFIDAASRRALAPSEKERAAALLEAQRHALLMFTSCGWFFDDISGIEAAQLLQYAARAIELAGGAHAERLEEQLLVRLGSARSNIPALGTGADIYSAVRRRSAATPDLFAGQFVLARRLGCPRASPEAFGWSCEVLDERTRDLGGASLTTGLLALVSAATLERRRYAFLFSAGLPAEVTCMLLELGAEDICASLRERFEAAAPGADGAALVREAAAELGGRIVAPPDLFPDDRETILGRLAALKLAAIEGALERFYRETRVLLSLFRESAVDAPVSLSAPAAAHLAGRLEAQLDAWRGAAGRGDLSGITALAAEADRTGIVLDTSAVAAAFEKHILELLAAQRTRLDAEALEEILRLIERSAAAGIEIEQHELQNVVYDLLSGPCAPALERLSRGGAPEEPDDAAARLMLVLARRLNFNTERFEARPPRR